MLAFVLSNLSKNVSEVEITIDFSMSGYRLQESTLVIGGSHLEKGQSVTLTTQVPTIYTHHLFHREVKGCVLPTQGPIEQSSIKDMLTSTCWFERQRRGLSTLAFRRRMYFPRQQMFPNML